MNIIREPFTVAAERDVAYYAAKEAAERAGLKVFGYNRIEPVEGWTNRWTVTLCIIGQPLPIIPTRLRRETEFPAEIDGQPYDLFWFNDEARGNGVEQWHRVTRLVPGDYLGLAPWVATICQRDIDDCWHPTAQTSDLSITIPTEDRCPECFGLAN